MKIRKREIAVLLVFVLISLVYYLFLPVFPGLSGDFGDGAITLFYSLYESVCEGTIALWNPHYWGGIPVLGQTCFQSIYPINLLFYFILKFNTFELFIVLDYTFHLSILCIGLYLFQRINNLPVLASFASVLMVVFSFAMMRQSSWLYLFTSLVWLPLIIDFIILFERNKSIKAWLYVLGAGISLGLSGLANQGQTLLINILIVCILYLSYIGTKFSKEYFWKMTGKMLSFGMIGISLCAPALLPAIEFTKNCSRYVPELGWLNGLEQMSLDAFVKYDTSFASLGSLVQFPTVNTDTNYYIFSAIGAAVSVLGILGFFYKSEKDRQVINIFVKIVFIFIICYSVGFIFPYIFYYIPFYNAIREPFLYIPYLVLPLTFFVGRGIELIIKNNSSLRDTKKYLFHPTWAIATLIICITGIVLPYRITSLNVILVTMLAVAYLGSVLLKNNQVIRKVIVSGLLFLVLTLQTATNMAETKNVYNYKDVYTRIERQKSDIHTIINSISPQPDKTTRFLGFGVSAWSQNALSLNQISDAIGYVNPIPRAAQLASTSSQRALLGNIKYWFSSLDKDSYHYQLLKEAGSYIGNVQVNSNYDSDEPETFALWELDTLGSAWVINDVIEIPKLELLSDQEVTDMLNDPLINFANQAYIAKSDTEINIEQGNNKWVANVKEYNNNNIIYEVSTEKKALLATPEIWYPGWNVYIDGKKQEVVQVNCCYRGCEVPTGLHTIEFIYQPLSLHFGILLSMLGIIYWFIIFCVYKRKPCI